MKSMIYDTLSLYPKNLIKIVTLLFFILAFFTLSQSRDIHNAQDLCLSVFGGVRCGTNYSSIKNAANWLITQFPLLLLICLNMGNDFSTRILYTLIRSGAAQNWWSRRYLSIVLFASVYALSTFFIVFLTGIIFRPQASAIADLRLFGALFLLYWLGCVLNSGLLIFAAVWRCSLKSAIILFSVYLALSIEIGWFWPRTNSLLTGSYSMIKRSDLIDTAYGFSLSIVLPVMVLLVVLFYFAGKKLSTRFIFLLQSKDFGGNS